MSATALTGLEIDRPGGFLSAASVGDEVPVMLLHHAVSSFDAFHDPERGNLVQWLEARGCRVIGFDLMGHGRSSPLDFFPDRYIDQCTEDADAVLDRFDIARVALLGVGFGGWVALRLAADHPHLVSCVLVDSLPGRCPAVPFEPWPGLLTPAMQEQNEERIAAWRRYARDLAASTLLAEPGRVRCPVLFTACGDTSSAETLAGLYQLARTMPHASVALLPGDRPPACWQSPGFFVREAERFFASYA